VDEEALPRRIIYVTPIGQRKTGRRRARWRETKGALDGGSCENVRNKELVVCSCEHRRMEATFKGGQDSYRVVEPMVMMMMMMINVLLVFLHSVPLCSSACVEHLILVRVWYLASECNVLLDKLLSCIGVWLLLIIAYFFEQR
jgi:hypothetical protein